MLKHHPDKKAAAGQDDSNDSFFKCIQRAHEILTDPVRRRQFDSVDEAADLSKKELQKLQKPGNFYKKWKAVFEREARFSKVHPVPMLGDENSTQEDVEQFYDFWYNFDSWRSFEYLDEDVPDDNADRDHKRHIEKKNANARRKRKTEDTARLRKLVDDCLSFDERIKKFRQQNASNKKKKAAERAAIAAKEAEEAKKARDAAEAKKKEEEAVAKAQKEDAKKAKEAAKNAAKKNKRTIRNAVKDSNYLLPSGLSPSAEQIDAVLDDADKIIAALEPEELADLAAKLSLSGGKTVGADEVKKVFADETSRLASVGKVKAADMKVFK